jgi:hypothetical protein
MRCIGDVCPLVFYCRDIAVGRLDKWRWGQRGQAFAHALPCQLIRVASPEPLRVARPGVLVPRRRASRERMSKATTAALTTIHRPCRAGRHVNDVAPYGAAVGHDRHFDLLITLFLIASVHGNRLERAQARDRGSRLRRVAYRPAPSGALMETRTVDRILTGSACAWTKAGNDVLGASVHRKVEPFADAAVAPITRRRRRRAVLGGCC